MKNKVLIVEDQFVEANYLRSMLERADYQVCGIARSVQKAREMIEQERPALVLLDIFLSGKDTGIDLAKELREDGIAFIYLSANSNEEVLTAAKATQPYGFLVKPFREKDLLVTLEIARYRYEHSQDSVVKKEKEILKELASITNSANTWEDKLLKIGQTIQPHLPFDYLVTGFHLTERSTRQPLSLLRVGYDEYQVIGTNELSTITGMGTKELLALSAHAQVRNRVASFYSPDEFDSLLIEDPMKRLIAGTFRLRSHLELPLLPGRDDLFSLDLYSQRPATYNSNHLSLFVRIQSALTRLVETSFPGDNVKSNLNTGTIITTVRNQAPYSEEPSQTSMFNGIIGTSHLLLNVFDHITQVASSDTSVLILGESGTGKERIADCIHSLSPRKGKPFIKINCAALPPALIESELFGHEKGAFTGAIERRIGKFELANKGTIFLDEIGEMPIELQVKLLRVLQEREVERLGANSPVKVDVRIIAATNRNLEKEVAEGRFRLDLYYRLNVFPITLPALRDRIEDLPILASHFIKYFSRKAGKKITGLSARSEKAMMSYHWPGNIRELEHFIERSVLLAKGATIEDVPVTQLQKKDNAILTQSTYIKTIQENERDHIMAVLKKCHGRIWGPGAAAEVLNVLPSTLKSKMKKLGIKKEYID